VDGENSLAVGAEVYRMVQLHTHWPSEHHVRGDSFEAEVHYVHVNAAGQPALVLGTIIREGGHNRAWDRLLALLPDGRRSGLVPLASVDVSALVSLGPLDQEVVYRYPGSLTTHPTCAGISWLVRLRQIELSRAQLELLRRKTERYARDPQPLGDRVIRYDRP
jgi:carbonic anhydrase